MNFASNILSFISDLRLRLEPSNGIEIMNPFKDEDTLKICTRFYSKFYNDSHRRRMIIGINPGRFGGGTTGIPFTDPIRLKHNCGIDNSWPQKQELSSVFIYDMINSFGGPQKFYRRFYISAVSPLGFTKDGRNLNYYDDKELESGIRDFIVRCMNQQLQFGIERDVAFCLGDGKNFKYLSRLNKEMNFFETIIPLSHPRFIMQYKLKKKEIYIKDYIDKFNSTGLETVTGK